MLSDFSSQVHWTLHALCRFKHFSMRRTSWKRRFLTRFSEKCKSFLPSIFLSLRFSCIHDLCFALQSRCSIHAGASVSCMALMGYNVTAVFLCLLQRRRYQFGLRFILGWLSQNCIACRNTTNVIKYPIDLHALHVRPAIDKLHRRVCNATQGDIGRLPTSSQQLQSAVICQWSSACFNCGVCFDAYFTSSECWCIA